MDGSATADAGRGASTVGHDTIDERHRAILRYLSAVAHAEPRHAPVHNVPSGPRLVCDVMVTSVVAARADALFKDIVVALATNHISAVPVVDERHRVIGVVSEADLLARVAGGHLALPRGHRLSSYSDARTKVRGATAGQLMTAPPIVTRPHSSIAEAARLAADARVRRMPVVDNDGVLVGVVSRSDLLRPFLRSDEEIRDDVTNNVVVESYSLDPNSLTVEVDEGVVSLTGQVEGKLLQNALLESVRAVSGVVAVNATALTCRIDDSMIPPPRPTIY
jgi:CBS domain-containing protein